MAPMVVGIGTLVGDRRHPENGSPHSMPPVVYTMGDPFKCAWPDAGHGRSSGPNRTRGGTNEPRTPSPSWAPQRTTKSGCAPASLSHSRWWKQPPPHERHKLRSVAGLFPFRVIRGVQGLRRRLVGPTQDLLPSPLWLTRFTAQHYSPTETPGNLRNMIEAPSGSRKHKRTHEQNTPFFDVDLWLYEARQINNSEAIQWFTRTILQQGEARKQNHKKPRMLNVPHNRWLQICTCMEDLAWANLPTTTNHLGCKVCTTSEG